MKTPDDSDGSASEEPGFDTQLMQGALEQRLFGKAAAPIRIGRFVVIDRLGEGGMGTVFRAYDPDLDRRVAVKLLKKMVADDPDREARLVREAKALAKLNHPNVVAVYEVGRVAERILTTSRALWTGRIFWACTPARSHPATPKGRLNRLGRRGNSTKRWGWTNLPSSRR